MIEIKNLTFTYPAAKTPTLKNINLNIEDGDFLAIIGNNGCGKSTFCKTLNGLIPHFIDGDITGDIFIDKTNTKEADIGQLACKVGYVYQDFENQIVRPTVLDEASYACLNYAYEDYEEKGKKAVKLCGLEKNMNDYIWQLSGGQKHLLALAGTISLSPNILILDEPIAQLDPQNAKKIYDTLKMLNEKYNKTIIVIEHHTEFIAQYCKNAILMKDGEILWKKNAKEALRDVYKLQDNNIFPPQITIAAKKLIDNNIIKNNTKKLPTTLEEGLDFFKNYKYKFNNKNNFHEIKEKKDVISFINIDVSYRAVKGKRNNIMKYMNLNIKKDEKVALIGSNGAGKSTIMKLIMGLIKQDNGNILIDGENIKDIPYKDLSKKISLVYQNPEQMFIKDSIEEDISFALKSRNIDNYKQKTIELLKRFNLNEIKDKDGRMLSGGQMRRASLAIGIALNPSILLLDEPTANLDIATRKEIMKTLNDIKDITHTVIIATHDMQLVCDWADRIIVLSSGQIIDDGNKDKVFSNNIVTDIMGINPPQIYSMAKMLDKQSNCYTINEFCNAFGGNA
ncbi:MULTISPECIES: ABC transporter ATP-binding protein [Anaerofustis]|uniref:ABC transporter ATP-binding protein n=1 Tax=Anaerofustis TaxID=264995 RepID=UPI001107461F|nr:MULTISPECIES: energy-coupling factor transporter ATPase [Anaerofustis]MCO8193409.1 energy-coupling factor transporter ATPase [Anaerofustis sp. NSJ-163]